MCQIVNGTTPRTAVADYWGGNVVWITPADLGKLEGKDIYSSGRGITKRALRATRLKELPIGTVVLSSRAPIGHLGIARTPLCTNQGCKSFIPSGRINSEYLYFILRNHIRDFQNLGSGSTFKEISKSKLGAFRIPLPPVSEQERIVGILDRQMGAVERARGAAVDRVEAVRALGAAFVREIFDFGGIELPRGWKRAELGEVCLEDRRGIDGASGEAAELPYLSLENVESMSGRIAMESNSNSRGISNCFRFGPEHILYGKLRPYLNKVALPNFHGRCTTELIPLLPKQNIRREFLALLLRRPETVDWAMSEKTGSRMPRANMKRLMKLDIFLPPVSEQTQIIATLNAKMATAEQARAAAEAELEAIEALPGALLRRAFGGEL